MSLILNIDTAVQTASICLAEKGKSLELIINPSQKDHSAWIHIAIKEILKKKGIELQHINAIAVTEGPGSFTGLRVGMATAKGLCYSLNIPLITIGTLKMMAFAAIKEKTDLLCPMIDARRMEVYTAIYDQSLDERLPPTNLILDETSFKDKLDINTITFFGNGSKKFKAILKNDRAIFKEIEATAVHMTRLSHKKWEEGKFADLAYAEPFYGKDFHSTVKQST